MPEERLPRDVDSAIKGDRKSIRPDVGVQVQKRSGRPRASLETVVQLQGPGGQRPSAMMRHTPRQPAIAVVRRLQTEAVSVMPPSQARRVRTARDAEGPPGLGGILPVHDNRVVRRGAPLTLPFLA